MKKQLSILLLSFIVLLTSSCATYEKTMPIYGIGGNNINTYVKANLDFDNAKKVEASIEQKRLLWFIPLVFNGNKQLVNSNRYGRLSKVESMALYRAQQNADCDIILEPQFTTETHSWFFGIYKTYKTQVKGWGCNVTSLSEDNYISTVSGHGTPRFF